MCNKATFNKLCIAWRLWWPEKGAEWDLHCVSLRVWCAHKYKNQCEASIFVMLACLLTFFFLKLIFRQFKHSQNISSHTDILFISCLNIFAVLISFLSDGCAAMNVYTLEAATYAALLLKTLSWRWCFTFSSSVSPAEVRGDHAIDIDPIAQLQGDGHSEPAGAQPGVWYPSAEERRGQGEWGKKDSWMDFMRGRWKLYHTWFFFECD